eukprot:snap_masked-scaffold_18-processed-gene-3.31-mRNA-1 protein AED:1.00 eAED:1.00 QI:0/-1/0/0/-1/1/1/0/98
MESPKRVPFSIQGLLAFVQVEGKIESFLSKMVKLKIMMNTIFKGKDELNLEVVDSKRLRKYVKQRIRSLMMMINFSITLHICGNVTLWYIALLVRDAI